MPTPISSAMDLASDAPQTDRRRDAYGYLPFARRLADAIVKTPQPEGLVMGIHGAWGSGKSTLLNFIVAELRETAAPLPIIIEFNPWWFEDHQALASQFLAQLGSKLLNESKTLRDIGDLIADYAESVGSLAATATGWSILKAPISYAAKLLHRKAKDVPTLKREITDALRKANERVVFVVDDIDRLTAHEIQEVFKVIKALANFPNVIYLLAFDRETVAGALTATLKMDGEIYLEKIVQAPFSLPAIDAQHLQAHLFEAINKILGVVDLPQDVGKSWGNMYFDGLDSFIRKPRDIVRIVNALSVTFPAVAGEVHPVDFVAMEFLRLFEPNLYATIRDHADRFTGQAPERARDINSSEGKFHSAWLEKVTAARRDAVQSVMRRLFPRLNAVWANTTYSDESHALWRKQGRINSRENFDVYFRFGVADDRLSRRQLNEFIRRAEDSHEAERLLVEASKSVRPDGTTQAAELVDALRQSREDISVVAAKGIITAIVNVGDNLLSASDGSMGGFPVPNLWRITWLVSDLLKCIAPTTAYEFMAEVLPAAKSMSTAVGLITMGNESRAEQGATDDRPLSQLTDDQSTTLQQLLLDRLSRLSDWELSRLPDLHTVFGSWRKWAGDELAGQRAKQLLLSEELLPSVLEQYLRFGFTQSIEDRVATRIPQLDPKAFEGLIDLEELDTLIGKMLGRHDISETQRMAGQEYSKGMAHIRRKGADSDDPAT